MLRPRWLTLSMGIAVYSIVQTAAHASDGILYQDYKKRELYWASPSEGARKLDVKLGSGAGGIVYVGGQHPVLSPDGTMFAYIGQDYNLWVGFLDGRKSVQVSKDGREIDEKFAAVWILITGWSPDSRKLLYAQVHRPAMGDSYWLSSKKPPGVEYGFFLYEIEPKSSRRLEHIKRVVFWLPDAQSVVTLDDVAGKTVLMETRIYKAKKERFPAPDYVTAYQNALSPDGKKLAFVKCENEVCRVVVYVLESKKEAVVSAKGEFAEFMWPRFSPDGKSLVYGRKIGKGPNDWTTQWIVRRLDRSSLFNKSIVHISSRGISPVWIGNQMLASSDFEAMVKFVNVDTKEITTFKRDSPAKRAPGPGLRIKRQGPIAWLRDKVAARSEPTILDQLQSFRHALRPYFTDHDGSYPLTLEALVPKYLPKIPLLDVPHHKANRGMVEIKQNAGPDYKVHLKDTGKWLYIADPKSMMFGTLVIDCSHETTKGERWDIQ